MNISPSLKLFLKIAVAIGAFLIIFQQINVQEWENIFLRINGWFVPPMFLLWFVGLLLSTFKWRMILEHYGIGLSFPRAIHLYWIGSFFNNLFPTSIGGDAYKFLHLKTRWNSQHPEILSSLLLERGIGLITILLFVFCFGLVVISPPFRLLWIGAGMGVAATIFFLWRQRESLSDVQSRFSLLNTVKKGLNTLFAFRNRRVFCISLATSALFLVQSVAATWYAFAAARTDIPWLLLFFLVPLIQLTGLVPFSINALGIAEGVGVALFVLFDVPAEVALTALLLKRIVLLLSTAVGGLLYPFMKQT